MKRGRSPAPVRQLAVATLRGVVDEGRSLTAALARHLPRLDDAADRALLQELAYGVMRWYVLLDAIAGVLLSRPLKPKDRDIHLLILLGIYQLRSLGLPAHAAINETVKVTTLLRKQWATGLVNGVLRTYQRDAGEIEARALVTPAARLSHPDWILERLQRDWPAAWESVAAANNARPPFTLRVNRARQDRDAYLAGLREAGLEAAPGAFCPDALTLARPVGVDALPGFAEGRVSVQDEAAQLAAGLLDVAPGMRVLDACAAPGGKTAHILECAAVDMVALDVDAHRLERVAENLERLGLNAALVAGDGMHPDAWWDGRPFERILLDAPCSATGVIRRHPDIKWLRTPRDVDALAATQAALLDALWPLLARGGMLLYATCSILESENAAQVKAFLDRQHDAGPVSVDRDWGRGAGDGRQILPGEGGMDGFYYACVRKS